MTLETSNITPFYNCGRNTLDIRSLVLTWEVAEDNPEHIDFWRITINKVRQRQRYRERQRQKRQRPSGKHWILENHNQQGETNRKIQRKTTTKRRNEKIIGKHWFLENHDQQGDHKALDLQQYTSKSKSSSFNVNVCTPYLSYLEDLVKRMKYWNYIKVIRMAQKYT